MRDHIVIKGARENNLKNIDVEIPRDALVVMTGLSGSGKSSLAFDTIFAEGQRRYMESLSSYARQFLGQMDKPDVDSIEGMSPAISIDQKTTSKNPRSTVGTVTEIYDYLRLLWARVGVPHCPKCGKEIRRQTVDQIVDQIMGLPDRTKFQILSPVVRGKKGEHQKVFEDARRSGYARVRVDGSLYELTEDIALDKNKKHHIEVVVDRLIMKPDLARRLTDSVETASNLSGGTSSSTSWTGTKTRSSPRTTPARTAASPCRSCPRVCSRSTTPTARARSARDSVRSRSRTRCSSSPTAPSRSCRVRFRPAAGTTSATTPSLGCILKRWRKNITFL